MAPGAANVFPLRLLAFRFATFVVDAITKGAVPVANVEVSWPLNDPVPLPIFVKPAKLAAVAPSATFVDPIVIDELARLAFGKPEISELAMRPLEFVSTRVELPVVPAGKPDPRLFPDVLTHCGT